MSTYSKQGFEFEGIPVSYIQGGNRGFPILMIHGSGPGASTQGNWRLVLGLLAEHYQIYAMDLIGFGESGRRSAPPYFDVDLWVRQCRAMIDRISGERLGVIGHSVSGAIALKLAAVEKRIEKVLTTGSMGAPFTVNDDTMNCWSFPKNDDGLLALARSTIHDQRHVTPEWLAGRRKILFDDKTYGPYFSKMFEGDRQPYAEQTYLSDGEIAAVKCPVTMIHGRDDRPFPPEVSIELARKLPKADLYLLAECSHSVALEHPEKLLAIANSMFASEKP
jgi:2-hydroxymuconate-semialdehyde hydrolase